jgi:predicted AAA+ superfamily ATPase
VSRLFSQEEVLRVLQGFNPWWNGRNVIVPSFRRAAFAALREHLHGPRLRTVLLLSGMRGGGKTTLLLQLAQDLVAHGEDPRSVIYLPVEHPIFSTLPLSEILRVYRSTIHPNPRPSILLLDEVHYAREWDAQVKELLLDVSGYRIIATESVRVVESALVTETQMGRWASVEVPSLSFDEFLRLRGVDPVPEREKLPGLGDLWRMPERDRDALVARIAPVAGHFRRYLTAGGLPELAARADAPGRHILHEDVAERALRRDVALHAGARNLDDLKRLFMYLCVHSGEVFRVQRYAIAVGASPSTVASHLALLEQCFLVNKLPPMGPEGDAVEKPRYKVFVADATMRSVQLLEDAGDSVAPEDQRASLVTCLARHVVRRYDRGFTRIGYWRDSRTLHDLDIVVHDEGGARVFQLADGEAEAGKRSPLSVFCGRTHVRDAFLVTAETARIQVHRDADMPTTFVRVPAPILSYLLGREESAAWRAPATPAA